MGVFKLVLTAMRGAGTVGVAAVDRLGADTPELPREREPVVRRIVASDERPAHALDASFPSQSESAALLDVYLVDTRFDRHAPAR
jgi:hypothetical protein